MAFSSVQFLFVFLPLALAVYWLCPKRLRNAVLGAFSLLFFAWAGLKGAAVGGAQVSEKHAGFLINRGGATAQDFLQLMAVVQEKVEDAFRVRLEPEVRIIGSDK